jgi:hypothetical protein
VLTGQRFDYLWRQVAGPAALVSSPREFGSLNLFSRTSFYPTTSSIHVFELLVFPLDSAGTRTGYFLAKLVRTIVDSASESVPEAQGLVAPPSISLTGDVGQRTILLDASGSNLGGGLSSGLLPMHYSWRQVAGPRGSFSNVYAARTSFTALDFGADATARDYFFELTVDGATPGNRSEPVYFKVEQIGGGGGAVVPESGGGTFGGGGGGGGCALGRGRPVSWGDGLLLVLPFLLLAGRKRAANTKLPALSRRA